MTSPFNVIQFIYFDYFITTLPLSSFLISLLFLDQSHYLSAACIFISTSLSLPIYHYLLITTSLSLPPLYLYLFITTSITHYSNFSLQ